MVYVKFNLCVLCEHYCFDEKRKRKTCIKGHFRAPDDGRCPDLKMIPPKGGDKSVKVLQTPQKEYGACRKAVIKIKNYLKDF